MISDTPKQAQQKDAIADVVRMFSHTMLSDTPKGKQAQEDAIADWMEIFSHFDMEDILLVLAGLKQLLFGRQCEIVTGTARISNILNLINDHVSYTKITNTDMSKPNMSKPNLSKPDVSNTDVNTFLHTPPGSPASFEKIQSHVAGAIETVQTRKPYVSTSSWVALMIVLGCVFTLLIPANPTTAVYKEWVITPHHANHTFMCPARTESETMMNAVSAFSHQTTEGRKRMAHAYVELQKCVSSLHTHWERASYNSGKFVPLKGTMNTTPLDIGHPKEEEEEVELFSDQLKRAHASDKESTANKKGMLLTEDLLSSWALSVVRLFHKT